MAFGRPPYFTTVEELEAQIEAFFEKCKEDNVRPTVTGLTLHLGFADKSSLYDYRDKKDSEFFHPIKKALTKIEYELEKRLENNSVAGVIFGLKNMGWTDKTDVNLSGSIENRQINYTPQAGNEPIPD